mgnify:CR=1 FL=1
MEWKDEHKHFLLIEGSLMIISSLDNDFKR